MIAAPPPPKLTQSYVLPSSVRALNLTNPDLSHLKLMGCYFAMLGVTLFWLVALTKYAQKPGCLPWCLTFTVISFVLAIRLFLEQIQRAHAPLQYSAAQESRSLAETVTGAYALTSLAICIAFFNTQWYKIDRSVMTQQMIEIDLTPVMTAVERIPLSKQPSHNVQSVPVSTAAPAPPTSIAPKPPAAANPVSPPKLKTAQSPVILAARPTAQSNKQEPIAQSIKQPTAVPLTRQPTVTQAATPAPSIANQIKSLPNKVVAWPAVANSAASALVTQPHPSRSVSHVSTGSTFFMEELPPAQLVEVRETDNSRPAALSSPTNNPSPAANMSVLADYLRELHRVIKSAWAPVRDNTRSAEIVFRIKRSGELALVKVVRSSGDVNSDECAINAITASAPFKPLPAGYTLASLDVDYTFNYTADKLTEVGGYH